MKSKNAAVVLTGIITLLLAIGIVSPSAATSPAARRARHVFRHASTCGDYERYAYNGGRSNKAWTQAVAGRYSGADDGCTREYATGHWVSDSRRTTATFHWMLGSKVIRKRVRRNCGSARGCSDLLRWTHTFAINSSGVRHYKGKRLTVRVTFSAPGFRARRLIANPAYDSGYYAHLPG